jgi:hypothetical protein
VKWVVVGEGEREREERERSDNSPVSQNKLYLMTNLKIKHV